MRRLAVSTCHVTSTVLAVLFLAFPNPAHAQISDDQALQALRARNIGPANMGGRVSDIEAVESDFKVVYVAAASGGVWKSDRKSVV